MRLLKSVRSQMGNYHQVSITIMEEPQQAIELHSAQNPEKLDEADPG
jgi:hypothetical protein